MSAVVDRPGVLTLVGSPKEVQAQLDHSQAERVLAVAFDYVEPHVFAVLAEILDDHIPQQTLQQRLFWTCNKPLAVC